MDKLEINKDSGVIRLMSVDGRSVAMMAGGSRIGDEENATAILTACNSHDYMVQTLQEIHRVAITSNGSAAMTCSAIVDMAMNGLIAAGVK